MTWRELADFISKMPQNHIDQEVRFVEPYDEGRAGYLINAIVTEEDIYVGPRAEETVFVKAGDPCLG